MYHGGNFNIKIDAVLTSCGVFDVVWLGIGLYAT